MSLRTRFLSGPRRCLFALAAPKEARAVTQAFELPDAPEFRLTPISDAFDIVLTGVGKASAAATVARVLDPARHACVISLGIAGALPESKLPLLSRITSRISVFADEGAQTPEGFRSIGAMGFPAFPNGDLAHADPRLLECLDTTIVSAIATVSTCSGTDAAATEIAHRTGAAAEAMEGAAVGLVAFRHNVAFAEVRVISNTTGDRSRQVWALEESLAELGKFVREHHDRAT